MGFEWDARAFLEPCAWWLWLTFLMAGVFQISPVRSLFMVTAIKSSTCWRLARGCL